MTNEKIKNNWAKMSKELELDVHINIFKSSFSSENVRSMTLKHSGLAFRILHGNSLLIISGDYGTYVFSDVHDLFTYQGYEYFTNNDCHLLTGNLLSSDVTYPRFATNSTKPNAAFKYSCEAIKLAVRKYLKFRK